MAVNAPHLLTLFGNPNIFQLFRLKTIIKDYP